VSYAMSISKYLSDDFVMYSGNDDIIVPMMSIGASGVISVLANTNPKDTHDIVQKYLDGDYDGSLAIQKNLLDYIHALFYEVNPIPVKEALNLMGKEVGGYRLPLYPMSEGNKARLIEAMKKVGML
ncbi:MAG: dihydrodipicolinate synthase family protein, partial [Solobacterium sp.]|nr:dihydrodipicolinate synthase family protein [Solobacterium sp.]